MGGSLRLLVFCSVFLGSFVQVSEGLQPLLGGQLTWEIHPNFMSGTRQVTFTLKTAFEKSDACNYRLDDAVACNLRENKYPECDRLKDRIRASDCPGAPAGTNCEVFAEAARQRCYTAEEHGVLCVRQLLRKSDGSGYQTRFWDDESQCVHDVNLWDATAFGTSPGKAVWSEVNKLGATNVIRTVSLHDKTDDAVWERRVSKTSVVVGQMKHTVTVEPNVVAVIAFFAPRYGFGNFCDEKGLVLPRCATPLSAANPTACSINLDSLGRGTPSSTENVWRTASTVGSSTAERCPIRVSDLGPQSINDDFWRLFTTFQGTSGDRFACNNAQGCLRAASPALETYVQVCSDNTDANFNCNALPVNNYFSPEPFLPVLTEVAVTALSVATSSGSSPGDTFTYETNARMAPHPPLLMQSIDYDGHKMAVSLPAQGCQSPSQCFPLNEPFNDGMPLHAMSPKFVQAQCFFGRLDGKFDGQMWPYKRCRLGVNRGRACNVDSDCGSGCSGCCARPPTGCRDHFDYDR
jgi:hypothetical protein